MTARVLKSGLEWRTTMALAGACQRVRNVIKAPILTSGNSRGSSLCRPGVGGGEVGRVLGFSPFQPSQVANVWQGHRILPMVFICFSHDLIILCLSLNFPMILFCTSCDFPCFADGVLMIFCWFSYDFPMMRLMSFL